MIVVSISLFLGTVAASDTDMQAEFAQIQQVLQETSTLASANSASGTSTPQTDSAQQSGPHFVGTGVNKGWQINVQGSKGTFKVGADEWEIEYVFTWTGLNGYANDLWFLGRKLDNYLNLYVSCNSSGDKFSIDSWDYRKNVYAWDDFQGSYSLAGIQTAPSIYSGYVPTGPVPNYKGHKFTINSQYCQMTEAEGKIDFFGTKMTVYPIMNLVVTSDWEEFWCVGYDAESKKSYHLFFYSNSNQVWIIQLWNGQINNFPLGKAIVQATVVEVQRTVSLP